MTIEQLENKLKISENTCIHCPTLELAKQVLGIFRQLGLKWCDKTNYTKHTYWNRYKENTIYCPFGGYYFPLEFVQEEDYKIISAEEFIALHTEAEEFNLETYEPKGKITGFPKEIIARMLDYQEKQGNKRDISIFVNKLNTPAFFNGFSWYKTKEGWEFWNEVIREKNFNLFFEMYPKKEEVKRWRAKKRESYYFIKRDNYNNLLDRVRENKDNYDYISNEQYKIGNYFKTKEEAEEIAEKMNTYFQKLVKI